MIDLQNYLATMPFIHSVYVYNPVAGRYYIAARTGQKGVIEADELKDHNIIGILDNYQEYKPFTPIPRMLKDAQSAEQTTGVYTYLCYDAIGFDQQINSAVVVNVSAAWINQELGSESSGSEDRTFVVDDRGSVRSIHDLSRTTWSLADLNQIIHRSSGEQASGYTVATFNDQKSLITYTAPDTYHWHYVRITPYQEITEKLNEVRTVTLQIAAIVLAAGLLLSLLLSRLLYVPIHKIENRMKQLECEKRDSSFTLRQNMLRKLVQLQQFHPATQLAKLKRLDIAFDFTQPYRLVYMRIDEFKQLKERHPHDILTYKFAIMNIASEMCSKHHLVESVDLEDDSLLMIMNVKETDSPMAETLHVLLQGIQQACREYLRIGLSVAYTRISEDPHRFHLLYRSAMQSSAHRFFLGKQAVISTETLSLTGSQHYTFPIGKERRMLDALMTGKLEDAKALFREILEETAPFPIQIAHSATTHLTVALTNMLTEIERNSSIHLGVGSDLKTPHFEEYETLEEMTSAFYAFFDSIKSKLVDKRSSKQEELVRRINELIDTRYADPSLSLNWVADELKMSTYHISRVYRGLTLTNIVDQINHVRLEKAKELLVHTDAPIAEISEQTGYTSTSYFHRIFKKVTGVTPSEFRKSTI